MLFLHLSTNFWKWILKFIFESIHIPRNRTTDVCSNSWSYILILTVGLILLLLKHRLSFCYRKTETPFIIPILYIINSSLNTPFHNAPSSAYKDLSIPLPTTVVINVINHWGKQNWTANATLRCSILYCMCLRRCGSHSFIVLLNKKFLIQLYILPFISIL